MNKRIFTAFSIVFAFFFWALLTYIFISGGTSKQSDIVLSQSIQNSPPEIQTQLELSSQSVNELNKELFQEKSFLWITTEELMDQISSNPSTLEFFNKEMQEKGYKFKSSSKIWEIATFYTMCTSPQQIEHFFTKWDTNDELRIILSKDSLCWGNLVDAIYDWDKISNEQKKYLEENCSFPIAQLEWDFETASIIMLQYYLNWVSKQETLNLLERWILATKNNRKLDNGYYYYRYIDPIALEIYKSFLEDEKISDCKALFLKNKDIIDDELGNVFVSGSTIN